MSLKLPAKDAAPTPQNVKTLQDGLTSVIVGHAGSIDMWTFYEEIENYLGPWGDNGYPIGYGKYYCKLFSENEKLKSNPESREWVKRTMVSLQESLRDFIVNRFSRHTLATPIQEEFTKYAFSRHAQIYNNSGLTKIVLIAPADARKRQISAYYRRLLHDDPTIRPQIDRTDPEWAQW